MSSYTASGQGVETETKATQCQSQLSLLRDGLTELHEAIENLTKKLHAVCRPGTEDETLKDTKESMVPFAADIAICVKSVRLARDRIGSLLTRLEL